MSHLGNLLAAQKADYVIRLIDDALSNISWEDHKETLEEFDYAENLWRRRLDQVAIYEEMTGKKHPEPWDLG